MFPPPLYRMSTMIPSAFQNRLISFSKMPGRAVHALDMDVGDSPARLPLHIVPVPLHPLLILDGSGET